jgi:hypothetical protein
MRNTGVKVFGRAGGHWRTSASLATLLLLVALASGQARADDPKPVPMKGIDGYWLGTLKLGAIEMRLGFEIQKKGDGSLTATGDSIDQGTTGLPIETVTFAERHAHAEDAPYEGHLHRQAPGRRGHDQGRTGAVCHDAPRPEAAGEEDWFTVLTRRFASIADVPLRRVGATQNDQDEQQTPKV